LSSYQKKEESKMKKLLRVCCLYFLYFSLSTFVGNSLAFAGQRDVPSSSSFRSGIRNAGGRSFTGDDLDNYNNRGRSFSNPNVSGSHNNPDVQGADRDADDDEGLVFRQGNMRTLAVVEQHQEDQERSPQSLHQTPIRHNTYYFFLLFL
jgi:hypothetical protein